MSVELEENLTIVAQQEVKPVEIYYKHVYEAKIDNNIVNVLVLFCISKNDSVVYILNKEKKERDNYFIESIQRYLNLYELREIRNSCIIRPTFNKSKPIILDQKEYKKLLKNCKTGHLDSLNQITKYSIDDINYIRWCIDKYLMNIKDVDPNFEYKQNSIAWVNLGYNVGSELRKIRPAILWRKSSNGTMWTVIPLTSKRYADNKYFHVDLEMVDSTAKIESMINISSKRIIEPKIERKKVKFITNKEYEYIKKAIMQYYAFAPLK